MFLDNPLAFNAACRRALGSGPDANVNGLFHQVQIRWKIGTKSKLIKSLIKKLIKDK